MEIDARLVKHLSATRKSAAFELNVHLQTDTGITVLFGSSGSGKTLTLNCLAGFIRPDEGRITVNGELYFDAATRINRPPERRRCGYIFQDHALFPHMNVQDNLLFAAPNNRRRMHELLEAFDLANLAERKPAQLSGGQKQRAALARIMMSEPRLLLLDEPTRGLDTRLRESFYEILKQMRTRLQIPVLLVTHQIDECLQLSDHICLLANGRIQQHGARDAVLTQPASLEIARSLGVYNLLPAEIMVIHSQTGMSTLRVAGQEIPGPFLRDRSPGDRGFLCIRESDVVMAAPGEANQLTLAIADNRPSSQGVRIQCESSFFVTVKTTQWEQGRNSTHAHFILPPAAINFFE